MEEKRDILKVDAREPQSIMNLLEKQGIEYERANLEIGDFLLGDVCIERKEITDYIQSLRTGHLQGQLLNMQENYARNYLIISGDPETAFINPYIKNWTIEHHLGSLASFSVRYNVKILQVKNDTQLVKLVGKIMKKSFDGKIATKMDTKIMKDTITTDDIKLKMICCIPLISYKKALALRNHIDIAIMDRYGKIIEKADDIAHIADGIGGLTAMRIMDVNRSVLSKINLIKTTDETNETHGNQ